MNDAWRRNGDFTAESNALEALMQNNLEREMTCLKECGEILHAYGLERAAEEDDELEGLTPPKKRQ